MLAKLGFSQSLTSWILFIGVIVVVLFPIFKVVPTLTEETRNLQYYLPKIEHFLKNKYSEFNFELQERIGVDLNDQYFQDGVANLKKSVTSSLLSLPNILASVIEWIFLVPLYLFFILRDGGRFKRLILDICPNSLFERYYSLTYQFHKKISDYIFAKFVEGAVVGEMITALLIFFDVRFSWLLGLIAGLTNVIPYVGPFIGSIPGVILAFVEFGSTPTTGAVITLYLVANTIDIALVFPILVSKIVDLHPIVVVISVVIGSQYLGILGMIISIPLAAAFKLILGQAYREIYMNREGL